MWIAVVAVVAVVAAAAAVGRKIAQEADQCCVGAGKGGTLHAVPIPFNGICIQCAPAIDNATRVSSWLYALVVAAERIVARS